MKRKGVKKRLIIVDNLFKSIKDNDLFIPKALANLTQERADLANTIGKKKKK